MILVVAAVVVALIALFVLFTYNRLVRQRLACDNSWAQIEVALKLRHDLVPNLVETVAGYAGHESAVFERTATARGAAVSAVGAGPGTQAPLEGALALGIGNLIGLAEAYPELKASENFAALQRELASVEERISITRRVYNDTVERFNTAVAVFPPSLVAAAFGFRPREFFSAGSEAGVAPVVSITPADTGAAEGTGSAAR
ncbi:MAG: LemA family protein [Solirubrobacterales bacterium]